MALELKCVIETSLIKVSYHCIAVTFTLTFLLNSSTQVTRQSALVIKVDVVCVGVTRCLKGAGFSGAASLDLMLGHTFYNGPCLTTGMLVHTCIYVRML